MAKTKKLLSLLTAVTMTVSAFSALIVPASAEDTPTTVTPTMTYVNQSAPDTALGYVTSAITGYNKVSGGSVGFGDTSWGVNYITYLKVDASNVLTDDVYFKSASLSLQGSGSTDGKRSATIGVGYTANTSWDETLTYTMAASEETGLTTITQVDSEKSGTSKNQATFDDYTFDVSAAFENDEDGIVTLIVYATNAAGTNIQAPSVTITTSDEAEKLTSVTVNNVVGEDIIATYEVNDLVVGEPYTATAAQMGYKLVDGVYYFPTQTEATIDALAETDNVLNIPFAASEESILLYEDFENITEWDITASGYKNDKDELTASDKSFEISEGKLKLTTYNNATGTFDPNYTNTKVFDAAVQSAKQVDISFDYQTRVPADKNRTSNFTIEDTNGNVIVSLFGSNGKVTYATDAVAGAESTLVSEYTGTSNVEGTAPVIAVDLSVDFEAKTVTGTIGDVAVDTTTTAENLGQLVARQYYSLAPQWIDNFKVVGEATITPPEPEEPVVLDFENADAFAYDQWNGVASYTEGDVTYTMVSPGRGTIAVVDSAFGGKGIEYQLAANNGSRNGSLTLDSAKTTDVSYTFDANIADGSVLKLGGDKVSTTLVDVADSFLVLYNEGGTLKYWDYATSAFVETGLAVSAVNVSGTVDFAAKTAAVTLTPAESDAVTLNISGFAAEKFSGMGISNAADGGAMAVLLDNMSITSSDVVEPEETPVPSTEPEETPVPSTEPEETPVPTEAPTPVPVDPKAVIDFTNRTLTYESKGSSTVFEVVSADTIAPALAAAGAGDVLQLGSNQNGASKMLGYKATFAKEGEDVVVYSGQVTMSFKLELNQVRTDKDARIELSFADINGTPILPITVGTGNSAYLTVNGVSASNIAYGSYYVVTYTMDFDAKTASVTIADAAGNSCLDTGSVAIEAENITQLYRADSDWLYGYVIIDDIKLDATNIGVPKFYTITVNTERYAKLTTDAGDKYFADVNGKIEIPLQTPGTTFGYTISKVGYTDVTGTIEPLTEDVVIDQPITKADENVIFIESEFGNENEAYVSLGGNRNDTVSLGEIALPDISEIAVDFEFAGFGNNAGQQKTWYINTDAGELVGIQINDNGLIAWTGWTGAANHNQSSDIGAFANSEKIGEMPSGAFTIKFVVDKANKAITVLYNDASYSLPYTIDATKITGLGTGLYRYNGELKTTELRIVEPDKEFMQLSGDTNFAKISGKTVTRSYIKSESVITPDETFTWAVTDAAGAASEAVTISQDGVLSVTDAAAPGVYTITCTGSTGKTASLDVTVQDFATVTPTVDGPKTYTEGQTGTYVVTALVDQYGDDVFGLFAPSFESSNTDVITIDAATGVATAVANGSADITITIGNPGKEAKVTIPATVDTYYVTADATGDSTVVDISAIVNKGNGTYQVTTTNNGVIVNQYIADAEDITAGGTVMALEADATAYTAIYNEDGTLQSVSTFNAPKGYVEEPWAIENAERYYWDNNMKPVNFVEMASEASITVDTTGADKVEIAPVYEAELDSEILVPNDRYNITVSASGRRTDFYVNDQLFINNINQGSDNWTIGRIFDDTTVKSVEDVVINEGYAVFNLQDNAGATVNGITFVKAPSTVARQQRIYVLGDSLVAEYYGNAPEGKEQLVRTGWGQVLENYIADNVGVTNLGNSGVTALGLRDSAFSNVVHSAQPGDIMILESGYNDKNYNTEDEMTEAVTYMVETAYGMGLKTFVVTPNASSHGTGQKPDVNWSGLMRTIAADLGEKTTLIDLAQESYDFLTGLYTTDGVMNWDIVTQYYNNEGDKLHSSNNAANCWARIIAQGLYDSGLTEIVDTEYSYTFNDGIADRVIQVEAE